MTATAIELAWAPLDDIVSYEIHRFETDADPDPESLLPGPNTLVYTSDINGWTDTEVVPGSRYVYLLVATTTDAVWERWTIAHAVTDTEPPTAIAGLALSYDESAATVTLTWNESADNYEFARYAIRRGIDGEQTVYYGTGWTVGQTSFVDDQLPDTGLLTYEVLAVDFHHNVTEPAVVSVQLSN